MANPIVFLDMTIGGEAIGRMEIELYAHMCPLTAENFRALCTGEKGNGRSGNPLHYKGSNISVVDPRGYIVGGAIINEDSDEGESIYDADFDQETSFAKQDRPGTLSMLTGVSGGKLSSVFLISTEDSPFLRSQGCSVFGQVLKGLDVLNTISTTVTSRRPTTPVTISNCGTLINTKVSEENISTKIFFDIAVAGEPSGRIIMNVLQGMDVVRTIENVSLADELIPVAIVGYGQIITAAAEDFSKETPATDEDDIEPY